MTDMKLLMERLGAETRVDVEQIVSQRVRGLEERLTAAEARLGAIPQARDGAPGARGEPGQPGAPGERGERGAAGQDGVGVASAFLDREGHLVVTFTNGQVKDVGVVVGAPGPDGLGFDDLDVIHDGDRTFTLQMQRGDRTKRWSFELPVLIDRGHFSAGKTYREGDGVTDRLGNYWIAKCATTDEPSSLSPAWRLAVRRGRDGKDGIMGPRGEPGVPGKDGRDLTQLAFDGKKY